MTSITVVRIYIQEGDKIQGHNLLKEIFHTLHDEHKVQGVTVFRGIAGFGRKGEVHADDLLRVTARLPLVVEFFDTKERVAAVFPALETMVPPGHMVWWSAACNDSD